MDQRSGGACVDDRPLQAFEVLMFVCVRLCVCVREVGGSKSDIISTQDQFQTTQYRRIARISVNDFTINGILCLSCEIHFKGPECKFLIRLNIINDLYDGSRLIHCS